jgi:hypothetical protein
MPDNLPNDFGELWSAWQRAGWKKFIRKANCAQKPQIKLNGGRKAREIAFSKLCEIESELWKAGTALCRARNAISEIHAILPDDSDLAL